ncbi:MAG: histidine--tRNA ligase [Chloroflexi bacterium]|nr:histidine--tRNA ligase [Chloroflexota bacterium]|tara:strand:+ start:23419 stop:24696 length:1278 start_codon:yes stop_codon:yes gene_type:complete
MKFTRPRGTSDILPEQQKYWNYVLDTAKNTANKFGFQSIETPTFEDTNLFKRGVGEGTDVVMKEMYSFNDLGGDSITLRPEGTASVCRAYIENGMKNQPQPQKYFYNASMFRYERPQAGRLREHHQFGCEIIGDENPEYDAEIIQLGWKYIKNLGLRSVKLKINTLGDSKTREKYLRDLSNYYKQFIHKLPKIDSVRLARSPLRLLDSKEAVTKELSSDAPKSVDYLSEESKIHWERLIYLLNKFAENNEDFHYEIDNKLVRGLDYYNRTVFEFIPKNSGTQGTILGGGRYDPLIEMLGGTPTPGIGFGSGIERMIIELKKQKVEIPGNQTIDVVIIHMGEVLEELWGLISDLRDNGLSTVFAPNRSMKSQMRYANNINAKIAIIVGPDEISKESVNIKDLSSTGSQKEVNLESDVIIRYIENIL